MSSKKIAKVFIILMIIISILVLIFVKKRYKVFTKKDIKVVQDYSIFYRINSYVNSFYSSSDINKVKSVLDNNYKKNIENIELDINNNIFYNKNNLTFKSENIKYVEYDSTHLVYLISGFIYENALDKINIISKNTSLIMVIDYNNFTYSIYPNTNKLLETVNNRKGNKAVEKNEYNTLPIIKSLYSKKTICNSYYYDYILKIQNIPEKAKKHTNKVTTDFEIIKNKLKESYKIKQCSYNESKKEYHIIDNNDIKLKISELNFTNYIVDLED